MAGNEEIQGLSVKVGISDDLFTQGISKINGSMKLLQSEFKASSESLKGFGSNTDQLKNKSSYLNSAIELQKAKIQQLKDGYEKAKTETGEYSNATQSAGTKVNNAVAYLARMQNELASVDSELNRTGADSKKVDLKETFQNAGTGIESAKSKILDFKNAIIGITATVAAGGGLFKFTEDAIQAGDNAYKLSQKLHLTTTETASLNKILSVTGTDSAPLISIFTKLDKAMDSTNLKAVDAGQKALELKSANEGLEKAQAKLTETMKKHATGSSEVLAAQQALTNAQLKVEKVMDSGDEITNATVANLVKYGVTLTDTSGKLLPINQQLDNMAKAYKKASDAGNEEAFSADVLGAKGQELIPLLENYTEAKEEASQVKGLGIDPAQAHEAEEQLKVLKLQVSATGGVIAKSLIPVVQSVLPPLIKGFQDLTTQIKAHKADLDSFIQSLIGTGKQLGEIVLPVVKDMFTFVSQHGKETENIITGIVVAFASLSAIKGTINGIVGAMKLYDNTVTIVTKTMKVFSSGFDTVKLACMYMGDGIKTAVSAVGSFAKSMGEAIIQTAKMTLELGKQAIAWIAQKVQIVASTIAEGAMTLAQTALNFVMSLNPISIAVIAIAALVAGLVIAYNKSETFRNIVNGAFNSVKETAIWVFNGIKDFLGKWGETILLVVAPVIGIPLEIVKHWEQIKEFFANLRDDIKQKIHDMFNFELPKLKLPHFSIKGSFDLAKGQIPSLDVSWYSSGGIFKKPTILGGIGVGDANNGHGNNAEAVVPLDEMYAHIAQIVQANSTNVPPLIFDLTTTLDGRAIAKGTVKYTAEELERLRKQQLLGIGGA